MKTKHLGLITGLSLGVAGMMVAMSTPAYATFTGCPALKAGSTSVINGFARPNLTGDGPVQGGGGETSFGPLLDGNGDAFSIPTFGTGDTCSIGSDLAAGVFNYAFKLEANQNGAASTVIKFQQNATNNISDLRLFSLDLTVGTAAGVEFVDSGTVGSVFNSAETFNNLDPIIDLTATNSTTPGLLTLEKVATAGLLAATQLEFNVFNLDPTDRVFMLQVTAIGQYLGFVGPTPIPVPPAAALFVTALFGLGGLKRKAISDKIQAAFKG